MHTYKKNSSRSGNGFAKPRARPLHAEAPCNYILGRLAAALQSVFETRFPPSRYFFQLFLSTLTCIIFINPLFIAAIQNIVNPIWVADVPADGFGEAFFKGHFALPAELGFVFGAVDGVTLVVAGAVFYVGDCFFYVGRVFTGSCCS